MPANPTRCPGSLQRSPACRTRERFREGVCKAIFQGCIVVHQKPPTFPATIFRQGFPPGFPVKAQLTGIVAHSAARDTQLFGKFGNGPLRILLMESQQLPLSLRFSGNLAGIDVSQRTGFGRIAIDQRVAIRRLLGL